MRTSKLSSRITLIALLGLASGCLYRMDIQQGNVLNRELVAQLEPGMTRSQVMFLLGTPMLPNGFNTDRWDYYCYSNNPVETKQLTVWFKDEKVDRVDADAALRDTSSTRRTRCTG